MALKTPVVDRIPTYPGRVKLTPVSGQTNTYDLVRADQPIEAGTPINKALFDQKAYTLTEDVILYVSTTGNDTTGNGTSSAPFATIQKAIDSLPKWLDGHMASIDIKEGTYNEILELDGFQGGILSIGNPGRAITVRGVVVSTSNIVRLDFNITGNSLLGNAALTVRNGSIVDIGGEMVIDAASLGLPGIWADSGSMVITGYDLFGLLKNTIKNCTTAVFATGCSRIQLAAVAGSNNTTGFYADSGSVITYGSRTLTATTLHVTSNGGRIYTGSQTNVGAY